MKPDWVIDLHNGGCASFPHMMALAQKILQTTDAKTAMIAAAQNAAGPSMTQSEIRKLRRRRFRATAAVSACW